MDKLALEFKADHDDYNAIMAEALADRLAEAFAEFLHKRVRGGVGLRQGENLSTEQLIEEQIEASARRQAIPPVRTTRRNGPCGSCSRSRKAPASG